jgi:hypothetical protein
MRVVAAGSDTQDFSVNDGKLSIERQVDRGEIRQVGAPVSIPVSVPAEGYAKRATPRAPQQRQCQSEHRRGKSARSRLKERPERFPERVIGKISEE